MRNLRKRDLRELQRITQEVGAKYKDRLLKEEYVTPTIRKIVDLALESDTISDKKKEQLRHLKDAGAFDEKEVKVNDRIARLMDREIEREITRSIAAGRLSKRPHEKNKSK